MGALPRNVPPKRLVADWNAVEASGAEEFVDVLLLLFCALNGATAADVDDDPPPLRPKPLRLPLSSGATNDANSRAAVVPERRNVVSTVPACTVASRMAANFLGGGGEATPAGMCCQ